MRQNRPIAETHLVYCIEELNVAGFRRQPASLFPPSKHVPKVARTQLFQQRRPGFAILSSLIELLLIGLLVCAVVLLCSLLFPSSRVSTVNRPAKGIDPLVRLTRTASDRLWVQRGYQEIVSVDLLALKNQTEFRTPGPPIVGSRISRDGMTFMVSLGDRKIEIFRNHELSISYQVPEGAVVNLSLSAGGTTAMLVLAGNKIRCWDLSDSNPTWTDYEIPKVVNRIALTPSGKMFVASTIRGEMDLYEATTGVRVKSLADVAPVKSELVFSDDGNWLAFAGSQTMYLYDMQSLNIAWQVPLRHAHDLQDVAIMHDGRLVAVENCRTGIQILSGSSGETLYTFMPDSTPLSMDFCESRDALLSTVSDGSIRIWSLATGSQLDPIKPF